MADTPDITVSEPDSDIDQWVLEQLRADDAVRDVAYEPALDELEATIEYEDVGGVVTDVMGVIEDRTHGVVDITDVDPEAQTITIHVQLLGDRILRVPAKEAVAQAIYGLEANADDLDDQTTDALQELKRVNRRSEQIRQHILRDLHGDDG